MIISDFKVLEKILKPEKIYNLYHFKSLKGFSLDSRSIAKDEAFVAIKGKHHNGHSFIKKAIAKGASFIVAEEYIATKPKVPFFIVENSYQALKSIATYIRRKRNPFVFGITGSLGKTTTKEVLSFLLSPHFKVLKNKGTENNLLGVAKTCFSLGDEEIMILELGTSIKGEIESLAQIATPDVGIITFVKPVHLEGLGSLKGVFDEKASLLKANPKMKAILNRDDPYLSKIGRSNKIYPVRSIKLKGKKIKTSNGVYWFGRRSHPLGDKEKNNHLFARLIGRHRGVSTFLIQDKYELSLPSYCEGFISNVLAAILGAKILGLPLGELVKRIRDYRNSLPLRMQTEKHKGFSILNDAYNANPHSLQMAFKGLEEYPLKKIVVIGDMLELGKKSRYYHELLAPQIRRGKFDYCLTLGEHTQYLIRKLKSLGYRKAFHFRSHKAIAQFINKRIGLSLKDKKRYLIFLKGSRKMELEKVIKYLR